MDRKTLFILIFYLSFCYGISAGCGGNDCSDADSDGFFAEAGCGTAVDCDDTNVEVYQGAPELCDGLDNDCDMNIPADEVDVDSDGWRICAGDCDDDRADIYPGAEEICDDGIDSDCDGLDCNPCTPVYDFQGGQVNLSYQIFTSVELSDGCNGTPLSEFFLLNLLNWCVTSIEGGGLGLLTTLQVPGYADLEGEESADLIIIAEPINIAVPMACAGSNIISQDDVFIDESSIDCAITAWANVTITPTSDSTVDAVIQLWEVTISGLDCPVDFTPDPECIMTFDITGIFDLPEEGTLNPALRSRAAGRGRPVR